VNLVVILSFSVDLMKSLKIEDFGVDLKRSSENGSTLVDPSGNPLEIEDFLVHYKTSWKLKILWLVSLNLLKNCDFFKN